VTEPLATPLAVSQPPERSTAGSIKVDHVSKRFGTVTAVDDVDIEVGAGEFFSLLGPSGCGKTTTLRLVAGFEQPTAGRILVGGDDVTSQRPAKRPLNMVFQDYALFPHLTVGANIAFGLKIKRLPRSETSERVSEVLRTMRLEGLADRRPGQLSGGQRQRVALARALVNRPQALLLDEPLGALDLQLRKQMQSELRRVHQQTQTTFLYVTHDQEEALTMSDRIAVMHEGRVQQLADPRTMYERPNSAFVAEFIGTSNLLELRSATSADGLLRSEVGEGQRLTAPAAEGSTKTDGAVQITVRPECITLLAADPGSTPTSVATHHSLVRGTVSELVYVGPLTQVAVALQRGGELAVHVMSDDTTVRTLRPGDSVVASWTPENSHVIGPVTS